MTHISSVKSVKKTENTLVSRWSH